VIVFTVSVFLTLGVVLERYQASCQPTEYIYRYDDLKTIENVAQRSQANIGIVLNQVLKTPMARCKGQMAQNI
jgi:hypothetical protein